MEGGWWRLWTSAPAVPAFLSYPVLSCPVLAQAVPLLLFCQQQDTQQKQKQLPAQAGEMKTLHRPYERKTHTPTHTPTLAHTPGHKQTNK